MSSIQLSKYSPRKAAWMIRPAETEKRSCSRSEVAFDVLVTPLDHDMSSTSKTFSAKILNFSTSGACVQHRELIVEPFVRIKWQANQKNHQAIIKLKWCRATGNHCFLTGGRVIAMESNEVQ